MVHKYKDLKVSDTIRQKSGFWSRISVKIILPILLVMSVAAIPLYLVVLKSVDQFASQNISRDIDGLSKTVFGIVDRHYMELLKHMTLNDPLSLRICQVDVIDAIEQFSLGQRVQVVIYEKETKRVLLGRELFASISMDMMLHPGQQNGRDSLYIRDKNYYVRTMDFTPWGWEIILLKKADIYADLTRQVNEVYVTSSFIWFGGTLFLIFYFSRVVTAPLGRIISSIRKGEAPFYQGTREFQFLADSIRDMMNSQGQARNEVESALQQLARASSEIEALLDNSPVGILFCNIAGKIQRVNKEFVLLVGYHAQEQILQADLDMFFSTSINSDFSWEDSIDGLKKGESCERDIQLLRKDQSTLLCHLRGRFVAQDIGTEGVVLTVEDVSRRRKMENELLKIQKLESVGMLAGGIAHDFNNLLAVILGNISLVKNSFPCTEEQYLLLKDSEKAAIRGGDLTQKFLTFSSGGSPVKATASIAELIKESADFTLSGSNVACIYNIPGDLWSVEVDRGQISQVIQNLALNACQAMGEGGTITIDCENVPASSVILQSFSDMQSGDWVMIVFRDTGPGIPEEIIDRVFDPYFSTKPRDFHKGSGLGLSIVHSVVTRHGGKIFAEATSGKGAVFTLYLPARPDKKVRKVTKSQRGEPRDVPVVGSRGRVLVMDDEPLVRLMVSNMLESLGYYFVAVESGEKALDSYRRAMTEKHPFTAVITDLTVPGKMGGEKAVQELLRLDPNAVVIVSSGHRQSPIMAEYARYGFRACMAKPYDLEALESTLDRVCGNNQAS